MKKTQIIEEYYYTKFAKASGLPLEFEHGDKPDIRIHIDKKTTGIEITNFYLRNGNELDSEQRQAPIRERIVAQAQKLYEAKKGRGIETTFQFNVIHDEVGLARKIANWLGEQNFTKNGALLHSQIAKIPELESVYVNIGPYKDAKWRNTQVFSTPMTSAADLQNIINEKEKQFDKYSKFEEMWLLVVIDFINAGMDQSIKNVDYSSVFVKKFDKVILYKTVYDEIINISRNSA